MLVGRASSSMISSFSGVEVSSFPAIVSLIFLLMSSLTIVSVSMMICKLVAVSNPLIMMFWGSRL